LECGSPAGEWIADGIYVCERCLSKWAEEAGVKFLRGTGRSADVKMFRELYREAREAGEA
jgi:ribosomal protein L37AE/L43A